MHGRKAYAVRHGYEAMKKADWPVCKSKKKIKRNIRKRPKTP
jgi:transposase InsO family protein